MPEDLGISAINTREQTLNTRTPRRRSPQQIRLEGALIGHHLLFPTRSDFHKLTAFDSLRRALTI